MCSLLLSDHDSGCDGYVVCVYVAADLRLNDETVPHTERKFPTDDLLVIQCLRLIDLSGGRADVSCGPDLRP